MKFIEVLKSQIVDEDGDLDMYGLEVQNLPTAVSEFDEDFEPETVDFENWGVTSITSTHMNMWAGGDWQDPVYMVVAQDPNSDELRVIYSDNNFAFEGVEDLDEEEILNLLNTL